MKGQSRLFLAILFVGILSGCSSTGSGIGGGSGGGAVNPSLPPATDSVSGTVTFKGSPLAGVTITAWATNTNSIYQVTTTDAGGNYVISGMTTTGNTPADFHIWAKKPGYGFYPSVGSGAEVIRADHTGQFVGNGVTDIGIYFTVIHYVALPNASLAGANFNAYDGSNPLVALAQTGQRTSYADGDDASTGKGVAWPAVRYTDNQDGTVIDNLTGLTWLKNAGCFAPTVWSAALADVNSLANGVCGLTDGSSAGQWRLPNIDELESVVDPSSSSPALTVGHPFTNVSNAVYWSSTSYFGGQGGSPNAWVIRLGDGRYMNDTGSNAKVNASNEVWAVKGNGSGLARLQSTGMYVAYSAGDDGSLQKGIPLTYPRWIDNGNGTVTDSVTGLVWLKKADCIDQPWQAALASVNSLASGQCGLTDGSKAGTWRMPNRSEMQSLSDRMVNNQADFFNSTYLNHDNTIYQSAVFNNFMVSQFYWTSTTNAADISEAWTVYSCDFGVYDIAKSSVGYTLAVR